ncbi:hypothetical protein FOL46_005808 [Perkinsus olseni]|uniref:Major facilitator superfamily (MFS) profile domain-containing protein n=1 Tax=Perkinsus olseni TaxID=32597 RepID=A0A7J6MRG2_PEROL|nr:hypothetical protein FOL46_005808 [Perkinsus olseni]
MSDGPHHRRPSQAAIIGHHEASSTRGRRHILPKANLWGMSAASEAPDEPSEDILAEDPEQEEVEDTPQVSWWEKAKHDVLQQTLPGTVPLLTVVRAATCVFIFGGICIAYGLALLISANAVQEIELDYTSIPGDANGVVTMRTIVQNEMKAPVYVHYRLGKVYQNHRVYITSVNTDQLKGGSNMAKGDLDSCTDWRTADDEPARFGEVDTRVLYPCGLIARSVFKDTFYLSVKNSTGAVAELEVDQSPERVTPKPQVVTKNPELADLVQTSQFYRTHNFWLLEEFPPQVCVPANSSTVPIPTRVARTTTTDLDGNVVEMADCDFTSDPPSCNFDPPCSSLPGHETRENPAGWGLENAHFKNWMITPLVPDFQKKWGVIDRTLQPGDEITVYVQSVWDALSFGGSKSLILSTANWQGGRNRMLGGGLIICGALYVAWGLYILSRDKSKHRQIGGVQYFHFHEKGPAMIAKLQQQQQQAGEAAAAAVSVGMPEFSNEGWVFEASEPSAAIADAVERDDIEKKLPFDRRWIPDMIFSGAHLTISCPTAGVNILFDITEALAAVAEWHQGVPAADDGLLGRVPSEKWRELGERCPRQVRVAAAQNWHPDTSNPDVHVLSPSNNNDNPQLPKADWTYTTAYAGTFNGPWAVEEIDDPAGCLPLGQLTDRSLPILWFSQVCLWEDELADNGSSKYIIRLRVMPGFWYVLASFLLRVDGVLVRLVETRLFHRFGTKEVIRNWTWRERRLDGPGAAPSRVKVEAAVAQGLVGCEGLAEDEGSLCFEGLLQTSGSRTENSSAKTGEDVQPIVFLWRSFRSASFNVKLGFLVTFLIKFSQSIWTGIPMLGYLYTITGGSNTMVGVFSSVQGLTCLACAPLAGIVADNISKPDLMRGLGFLGIFNIGMNFALFLTDQLWIAYPSYILWGTFTAFSETTLSTLIADGMSTGNRAPLESLRWTLAQLATASGPILNALILSLAGNTWTLPCLKKVLLFGSSCAIFGMVADMFFRKEDAKGGAKVATKAVCEDNPNELVEVTIPFTHRTKLIRSYTNSICIVCAILGQDVITALGSGMSVQYFQLWFKNDYGVDPRTLAILNVVTTLTVAFMTYAVTNELATRFGTVKVVVTIRLTAVLLLWAMVIVRPIGILLVLYVIRMAFMNCSRPVFRAMLMDHTPRKDRGKVNAVDMVRMFSWSGSAAIGGLLVDHWGYRFNFIVTGLVHCCGLLCVFSLNFFHHTYHGKLSKDSETRVDRIQSEDLENDVFQATPRSLDEPHYYARK